MTKTPVIERMRRRPEFLAAAKGLACARGAVLVQALARPERASAPRPTIGAGFTATKRVGGAVVRNRAKRRLREAARLLLPLHGRPGFDYVFIARSGAPSRPWPRLLDDMKSALIRLASDGGASSPKPDQTGAPADVPE
jgi:ribonuclease P protein component